MEQAQSPPERTEEEKLIKTGYETIKRSGTGQTTLKTIDKQTKSLEPAYECGKHNTGRLSKGA